MCLAILNDGQGLKSRKLALGPPAFGVPVAVQFLPACAAGSEKFQHPKAEENPLK